MAGNGGLGERGITTFEVMLILLFLCVIVATLVPAYLASRSDAQDLECSLRLAVIQEAKRDVMKEMNDLLPRENRLRITDEVNPLHYDKIAYLTLRSPWNFHPEDPCPDGSIISVGATFLEPPSSSGGHKIAEMEGME
jgi:hypothetical protein